MNIINNNVKNVNNIENTNNANNVNNIENANNVNNINNIENIITEPKSNLIKIKKNILSEIFYVFNL